MARVQAISTEREEFKLEDCTRKNLDHIKTPLVDVNMGGGVIKQMRDITDLILYSEEIKAFFTVETVKKY